MEKMSEGKCSSCSKMCILHKVAYVLAIIGALNWGLIAVGGLWFDQNWNIVSNLLYFSRWAEGSAYILIGLSGLALCFSNTCGRCKDCCGGKCDVKMEAPEKSDSKMM